MIEEEFETADRFSDSNWKKIIEGADLVCALYEYNEKCRIKEKLKQYKMGCYFDEKIKNRPFQPKKRRR